MKLLAPLLLSGTLGTLTKREKYEIQCGKTQTVAEYANCPCLDWFWKGGKLGKNLISGLQDAGRVKMFQVSVPDQQASFSFRDADADNYDPDYKVFLQFVKYKCGVNFLEKVADGTVKFHFMDSYAAYSGNVYQSDFVEKYDYDSSAYSTKPPKKNWSVSVQMHATNTLQKSAQVHNDAKMRGDIPYNGKSDSFPDKKDQIMVFVEGMDTVSITDDQVEMCFANAFIAVAQCENDGCIDEPDWTDCVNLAHIYW